MTHPSSASPLAQDDDDDDNVLNDRSSNNIRMMMMMIDWRSKLQHAASLLLEVEKSINMTAAAAAAAAGGGGGGGGGSERIRIIGGNHDDGQNPIGNNHRMVEYHRGLPERSSQEEEVWTEESLSQWRVKDLQALAVRLGIKMKKYPRRKKELVSTLLLHHTSCFIGD